MSLILLPNTLTQEPNGWDYLPPIISAIAPTCQGLIGESQKQTLRYLKHFPFPKKPHLMPHALLNEHTKPDEYDFLLEPLLEGETWGLISDAGLPLIADPGSQFIAYAKQRGISVQAIPGPSSLFLGLMQSGLPTNRFQFHGYPPRDPQLFKEKMSLFEERSKEEKSTQILIAAPYQNQSVWERLLDTLHPTTKLTRAKNLTGTNEVCHTAPVSAWREEHLVLDKEPTLFLFCAQSQRKKTRR